MSTIAKIILILNVLSTNIYPLEADGQDGQLPTQILAECGVRELIWNKETRKYYKSHIRSNFQVLKVGIINYLTN